jgi:hypothetical protein
MDHILSRNCLLKHVNEGKIEGRLEETERRGRRSKKLFEDLKEKTGYCKVKEGCTYVSTLARVSCICICMYTCICI